MTAYRQTGPGALAPPVRPRRPVGAKVLMTLGLVMVAGAVVAFMAGTHRVVDGGRRLQERADRLRRELVVELEVPGRTTVQLRPGTYNIYDLDVLDDRPAPPGSTGPAATTVPGATDPGATDPGATDPTEPAEPGATATTQPAAPTDPTAATDPAGPATTPPAVTDRPTGPGGLPVPTLPGPSGEPGSTTVPGTIDVGPGDTVVTITDAGGIEVEQEAPSLSSLADAVGGKLLVQQQVRIDRAGTYTVEATGVDGAKVGIGRVQSTSEVGRVVGGAFLTISAIVLGGLGVLATAGGLIWLLAGGTSSPPPGGSMPGWSPPPPMGGFGPPPPPPPGGFSPPPPPPPPH